MARSSGRRRAEGVGRDGCLGFSESQRRLGMVTFNRCAARVRNDVLLQVIAAYLAVENGKIR